MTSSPAGQAGRFREAKAGGERNGNNQERHSGAADLEAKVLKTPGVVAVDFYQASCPPCRALEPRLEKIARQYENRLPVYRVEIDRDMPIEERFGVKSIPTILVDRGGREVARLDGLITDRDLTAAFDREAG